MAESKTIMVDLENATFPLRAGEWLNHVERIELIRLLRPGQRDEVATGLFSDITVGHAKWSWGEELPKGDAIVHAIWRAGGVYLTFEIGVGVPKPVPKSPRN
jgi:hypothetical protein